MLNSHLLPTCSAWGFTEGWSQGAAGEQTCICHRFAPLPHQRGLRGQLAALQLFHSCTGINKEGKRRWVGAGTAGLPSLPSQSGQGVPRRAAVGCRGAGVSFTGHGALTCCPGSCSYSQAALSSRGHPLLCHLWSHQSSFLSVLLPSAALALLIPLGCLSYKNTYTM